MLVRSVVLTAALAALAGCSSISSTLGLERHIPDETQVTVRPALTLPPDFNLVPPGTETAVSGQHEEANPNAVAAADGSTPAAPKKEERGFFGSLFHGDFFGNDVDEASAKEHAAQAQAAAPDVNGTPQAPTPPASAAPSVAPPADAPPPADAAPAPAPKKDEPGFFSRVFGGIF
jgi:Protein of unknown function (DUF3035)